MAKSHILVGKKRRATLPFMLILLGLALLSLVFYGASPNTQHHPKVHTKSALNPLHFGNLAFLSPFGKPPEKEYVREKADEVTTKLFPQESEVKKESVNTISSIGEALAKFAEYLRFCPEEKDICPEEVAELWKSIRDYTYALSLDEYRLFVQSVMHVHPSSANRSSLISGLFSKMSEAEVVNFFEAYQDEHDVWEEALHFLKGPYLLTLIDRVPPDLRDTYTYALSSRQSWTPELLKSYMTRLPCCDLISVYIRQFAAPAELQELFVNYSSKDARELGVDSAILSNFRQSLTRTMLDKGLDPFPQVHWPLYHAVHESEIRNVEAFIRSVVWPAGEYEHVLENLARFGLDGHGGERAVLQRFYKEYPLEAAHYVERTGRFFTKVNFYLITSLKSSEAGT